MASLADLWPMFGLLIETPRLRLHLPSEDDLIELAVAARSIGAPGARQFQLPWMYEPSPQMERQLLQRHWRARANWRPESWHLLFAVSLGQRPIGVQELWATDFARIRLPAANVAHKLKYVSNGARVVHREREGRIVERHLRLDRETWKAVPDRARRVLGVAACLELFGIA